MPTHKVKNGYKWGKSGKIYPTKKQADKQGRAIYASGWRENKTNESKLVRITEGDLRRVLARTILETIDDDMIPDNTQWHDAYKEAFGEYPSLAKREHDIWGGDEEYDEPHSKEDEINASWEAYENTMDDYNGEIPTALSNPNSEERNDYDTLRDKYDEYTDRYSDGDYSIVGGDYPNKFTDNDEGYQSMLAQGYDSFLKQELNNENKVFNKMKVIRLTESDLHQIIKESAEK